MNPADVTLTNLSAVSREEVEELKDQVGTLTLIMQEQVRVMQELKMQLGSHQSEVFIQGVQSKGKEKEAETSDSGIRPLPMTRDQELTPVVNLPKPNVIVDLDQGQGNKVLEKKIHSLEETLRTMQGFSSYGGVGYSDLCLFPMTQYPKKFQIPDFDKYSGKGDPYIHLKTYIGELGAYAEDEKLRIQLFQKSLTGPAKTWYARLDSSKIRSWEDLANSFMNQYGFHSQTIPDRFQLMRLKKKPNESFQDYARRWRDLAAEVEPPLDNDEMVRIFINSQDAPYFGELLPMLGRQFKDVIYQGGQIEEGIRSGKLIDSTALKAAAELIQAGNYPKKNTLKKDEDVALILQGIRQQQQRNPTTSDSGAQNNPTKFNQEEKRVRYERNRARVFTPLDEPLDKVLAVLLNQKKITSLPPMPSRETKNFDPTQKCAYHSGGVGHSTEKCWSLKHKIQDLIDSGDIVVSIPGEHNVTANPLPKHHESQVNFLELEVMIADQRKSIPTAVRKNMSRKVGDHVSSILARE